METFLKWEFVENEKEETVLVPWFLKIDIKTFKYLLQYFQRKRFPFNF